MGNKNNTLMLFAAVNVSYLFYGNNIANGLFKNVFQSNFFAVWNENITKKKFAFK